MPHHELSVVRFWLLVLFHVIIVFRLAIHTLLTHVSNDYIVGCREPNGVGPCHTLPCHAISQLAKPNECDAKIVKPKPTPKSQAASNRNEHRNVNNDCESMKFS